VSYDAFNLCIGGPPSSSVTSFDGKLDDVRIYSRTLTAAEVKQLNRLGAAIIRQ
jgi:Concanavalin A-like lectin/glucanases superfamily